MILFKTIQKKYVSQWREYHKTASFREGARWNYAGVPVMYLSSNPQNAMLEVANYMPNPTMVNKFYDVVVFEFPALRIHDMEPKKLPSDWASDEHEVTTQNMGSMYLKAADAYDAIRVPSATINAEMATHALNDLRSAVYANVVVNPETIGLNNMKMVEAYSPVYSHRMFQTRAVDP